MDRKWSKGTILQKKPCLVSFVRNCTLYSFPHNYITTRIDYWSYYDFYYINPWSQQLTNQSFFSVGYINQNINQQIMNLRFLPITTEKNVNLNFVFHQQGFFCNLSLLQQGEGENLHVHAHHFNKQAPTTLFYLSSHLWTGYVW